MELRDGVVNMGEPMLSKSSSGMGMTLELIGMFTLVWAYH